MALRFFYQTLFLIALIPFCKNYPFKCEIIGQLAPEYGYECDIDNSTNIDERCKEAFVKECKLAHVKRFCKLGADAVLDEGSEVNCKPTNLEKHEANLYYSECCEKCKLGLTNGEEEDLCRTSALDSDRPEYYVQEEYSRCCLSKTQKSNSCSKCEQICGNDDTDDFDCSCTKGYVLNKNGYSCDHIDECALEANLCPLGERCYNTPGGYKCIEEHSERDRRSEDGFISEDEAEIETDPYQNDISDDNSTTIEPDTEDFQEKNWENMKDAVPKPNLLAIQSKSRSNLLNPQISLYVLVLFLNILLLKKLV